MKIIDQIKKIIENLNPSQFKLSRQSMAELVEDHRQLERQLEDEKIKNRLLGNVIQKHRLESVNAVGVFNGEFKFEKGKSYFWVKCHDELPEAGAQIYCSPPCNKSITIKPIAKDEIFSGPTIQQLADKLSVYGTNDFSSDLVEREANREKLQQRIKAAIEKNGGKFSIERLSAKPQPIAKNEAVPAGATHYAICGSTGRKSYYKNVDGFWFWKTSFEWERSVAGKEWLNNRLIAILGSERVY